METLKQKIIKEKEKFEKPKFKGGSLQEIQDAITDIYDKLEELSK